jgi:hypothetical protein
MQTYVRWSERIVTAAWHPGLSTSRTLHPQCNRLSCELDFQSKIGSP